MAAHDVTQPQTEQPRAQLWTAVDHLLDSMNVPTVLAHGLGPLAAARWRQLGRPVPRTLAAVELLAQATAMQALPILSRVRAAYTGRLMILKGPEIEVLYPRGGRLFGDLDILVDDAAAARDALLAAGFETIPGADPRPHHLPPVLWPGSQLPIELHTRLNWPRHLAPPSNDELFAEAVRSALPVEGLEAPRAAHHALLVAAHSWKQMPLGTIRDLVDVSLLAHAADAHETEQVAQRWELGGIWRTTTSTSRWLFDGGSAPAATRVWAWSLRTPREPTILERHVRRWITPFWMLPFRRAVSASAKNIVLDMRPVDGEGWSAKLRRTASVATHPSRTRSGLGDERNEENF